MVAAADDGGDRAPVGWRMRPGLRFDPAETVGRYRARNPDSGERFELGEEEVFLCRALVDAPGPEAIRAAFKERFGLSIAAEQLDRFYRDMAALGLLEAVAPAPTATPPDPSSAGTEADAEGLDADDDDRPGVPYRWALLDPHRGFAWLAERLAWLRHAAWLLVPGVPLALLVLLFAQPQYRFALEAVADPGLHLLFKLVFGLFFINLFSKLAQGLTCVGCGGRADQFGIRLAFGAIPRFFVGKRLRGLSREQRLRVAAAPLLTKLALFVVGTLLWRFTLETGGTLGAYGFVVGHMALGAFLFTANPLWRADGYVWLTHLLRMPRLRERAFRVLGLYLRGRRPPTSLSAGEKYGLLGYAVASAVFVLVLVGLVLLVAATRLELRFQGVGVVLFLVLVASAARWYLARLARRRERGNERSASVAVVAPAVARGAEPAVARSVRGGANPRSRYGWRLAIFGLLFALSLLPYSYDVTGDVTLFPTARAEVHAVTPGVVDRVLVRENQWIGPDQTLAELSAWQQDRDIAAIESDIERKRAELELLLHGPKAEAVEAARAQLAMAEVRAIHSRKVQKLLEPVHRTGVVKDLEYQEAVKTAEVDQAAVAVATANLNLIKSPPLPMEVAVKQAEIKQLREQLHYLRDQRERTRLRSPVEGMIVTPRPEFMTGGFLKEGDPFATVEDNRILRAEILAPETDIGEVRPDAQVRLRVWAYPWRDFTGRVAAVAPVVEPSPANPFVRVVRVVIEIPNPDGLLRSQMTGVAKIAAGDKPFIVAFTRALVRFVLLEMWSWLP